jgi:excisionase family DNA binding protein
MPQGKPCLGAGTIQGQGNGSNLTQTEATSKPTAVYLTSAEVAELLHVSVKTVSRISLEDASMPVLRRGRVVRFHRERLMQWLERQEPRGSRQVAKTAQSR